MTWGLTSEALASLKVGDQIGIERLATGAGRDLRTVGKVERITPSRSKFVVAAGERVYAFNKHGEIRGGSSWDPTTRMVPLTADFLAKITSARRGRRMAAAGKLLMTTGATDRVTGDDVVRMEKALNVIQSILGEQSA